MKCLLFRKQNIAIVTRLHIEAVELNCAIRTELCVCAHGARSILFLSHHTKYIDTLFTSGNQNDTCTIHSILSEIVMRMFPHAYQILILVLFSLTKCQHYFWFLFSLRFLVWIVNKLCAVRACVLVRRIYRRRTLDT